MAAAAGGAGAGAGAGGIDQNLYSRQLAVFGGEAMGKLIQMKVLIIGTRGLGVEIAKNLILAGPKSVTLYDPELATMVDLGSNYYLAPSDVGKHSRAAASVGQLAELNPYVSTSVAAGTGEVSDELVKAHHLVIASDVSQATALRINATCRAASPQIAFIYTGVLGATGFAFVDFGDSFTVRDINGEHNKSAVITGIFNSRPRKADEPADAVRTTIVNTLDSKRHGFADGDYVIFREVEGMTELNDGKPRRIVSTKAFSFEIEADSSTWGEHTVGGIVEQVKVPTEVKYASLATRIVAPAPADDPAGLITADLGKFGRPQQLHLALAGLEAFRAKHGDLPALRDGAAVTEVVALAREWQAAHASEAGAITDTIEEKVVANVTLAARAQLPALCAFFGGVVAQEAVKFTGKFTPLRQWLYLDAFEVFPEGHDTAAAAEFAPAGNRYDNAVAIIGRTEQTKVMNQRAFVVGAGALGCEFLKSFALMGVGCGPSGRVVVTDMDRIEVSNLNRQFLFRPKDVGQPKSITAARAAQVMNPDLKIDAMETPVGETTEGTFNDEFWTNLDIVVNALDNVKARQYVDTRCIFFGKPLLESGTLGTKANTQVVIPRKTECYSDSQDAPEESIPMCTLRNFPHAIEHCIEWARDMFAGCFTNTIQEAATFVSGPAAWLSKVAEEGNVSARRSKMSGVASVLTTATTASWRTCVEAARNLFNEHFYLRVRQLLTNFPPDYADPSTGVKFWSPPKRVPTAVIFSPADPEHFSFVVHAAALNASNYNVALPAGYDTHEVMDPILAAITVPEFVPKGTRIKASEADTTEEGDDDDGEVVTRLGVELAGKAAAIAGSSSAGASAAAGGAGAGAAGGSYRLTPAEFEKDDDSNHHVDFITACANLRARTYKIREATRYDVKLTAGRIIPAIATTTCTVTGLVCVEAYKVIAGKPVEATRNSFINLAINLYSMAEPMGPRRTVSKPYDPITMSTVRAQPEGFTRWDRHVIKGSPAMTPVELNAWLEANHHIRLTMLNCGKTIVYAPGIFASHVGARGGKPIRAILEESLGHALVGDYIVVDAACEDDDGDVLIPPIQLFIK